MRLTDLAFGARPGDDPAVIQGRPPAPTGHERWLCAITLAGQGHYHRALTELAGLCRPGHEGGPVSPVMLAAALTATGSCARQCGDHRRAAAADGRAVRAARAATVSDRPENLTGGLPDAVLMVDAVVGLAADHLGLGDLGGADRLLDCAERTAAGMAERPAAGMAERTAAGVAELTTAGIDVSGDSPTIETWMTQIRPSLRATWVRAELGLYRGDLDTATAHATAARDLSRDCPSVRHQIKTELIVAACHAAAGRISDAVEVAVTCRDRAAEHDLWPLRWAAGRLLSGIPGADVAAHATDLATARVVLNRRGGCF